MNFVYQSLTWGFFLALVPLVIHLINLLRHQRVQWAAMEFLLASYRKHRTWVWLKQLALLALRMLAIALLVAMLARWVTQDEWFSMIGGKTTHHYILLDDSYSMSERIGGSTAFDRARQAIGQIAARAMEQDSEQKVTLIRFSRAASLPDVGSAESESVADLNATVVDADFDVLLEQRRNAFDVSQLAVGPSAALRLTRQLLRNAGDETQIVYVVSDFRSKDWTQPGEMRQVLQDIEKQQAEIHFVRSVTAEQPNLGIVDLQPSQETRAAGVPLFVNVTVRNFGSVPARRVQLKAQSVFFDSATLDPAQPEQWSGDAEELPTVMIEEIAPGASVTRQVQVYFPKPGQHVVEVSLPEDAVAADNRRWTVIDFPEGEPVLIVDGSPSQQHAYYLASAFQPGSRANTGVRPETKSPAFLRDSSPEALQSYRAIYLLDVQRLDARAVENLEAYVRQGGGLGIFMGENVNVAFYNQVLYRDGEGILPVPLERVDVLPAAESSSGERVPDLLINEHPIFQVFAGQRNPLIRMVNVDRYLLVPRDWKPDENAAVEVFARLRNQMPLAVEQTIGEGRVVAFLTTAAPLWNNWALDPSFVVAILKLQSHLAAAGRDERSQLVGTPIELELDAQQYRSEVSFVVPGGGTARSLVKRTAAKPQEDAVVAVTSLGSDSQAEDTGRQGVYEAWLQASEGDPLVQRWALNVEPGEGNLSLSPPQALISALKPFEPQIHDVDDLTYASIEQAGYSPSLWLMILLILLLLGEQIMGYFTSYHPARGAVR